MILIETQDYAKFANYVWRCTCCFYRACPLPESPMNSVDLKQFHAMLLCFVSCVNPRTSAKLNGSKAETLYPTVFRKAASYYFRKKI